MIKQDHPVEDTFDFSFTPGLLEIKERQDDVWPARTHWYPNFLVDDAKKSQQFKADAGKAMPDLFELGFSNAIRLVQATMEYGAQKYEAHSWQNVPNGMERYNRAGGRHRQDRLRDWKEMGLEGSALGSTDKESGLPHIAHEIFNLMALTELALKSSAKKVGISELEMTDWLVSQMKEPTTSHKLVSGSEDVA